MTTYRIIIPAAPHNAVTVWKAAREAMARRFGGCTGWMANGDWLTPAGAVQREDIFVIEATRMDSDPTKAAGDWPAMQALARYVKHALDQSSVYISYRPEEMLLI